MAPLHSILASDDETMIKVVGAVVVLIIWGISSLASAMGKARQRAVKQQQQNRTAISAAPPAVRPRPVVSSRRAPAAPPPLPRRTAATLPPIPTFTSPPRQVRPAVAKTAPLPKTSTPAAVSGPMRPSSPLRQVAPTAIPSLLRPKTVRAQFILAEVLQPPLALRNRKMF